MSKSKTLDLNIKTPVYTGLSDKIRIVSSNRTSLTMIKLLIPKQVDVSEVILNELNPNPKRYIAICHNDKLFKSMDSIYETTNPELPYDLVRITSFSFMLGLENLDSLNDYRYKSIYEIRDFKIIIKCFELLSENEYNDEDYNELIDDIFIDNKIIKSDLEFLKKFYIQNAELFI